VKPDQKSSHRKKFLWVFASIILGALVSTNHFYAPELSLQVGIIAWFADLAVVLIYLALPKAERVGILLAGLCFAIPCFLRASPLGRGLLMCCMAFPFALAAAAMFAPKTADFRARLAYFFTWMGTRKIQLCARSFDTTSLFGLVTAAVVFAAALTVLKSVSAVGIWLIMRWLAGGIMIFAFAEMASTSHDLLTAGMGISAPAWMRSPILTTSVGEFWTKRWNVAASAMVFHPLVFAPLARRRIFLALFMAFLASAVAHMLLAYMAMVRWKISLICGAFFLVQPLLILAERKMKVNRWPTVAARVWTLSALAITSPLFVEPVIQFATPSLRAMDNVLGPTLLTLGFAIIVNVFFAVGQLASGPRLTRHNGTG
jgi:hypothetical protein